MTNRTGRIAHDWWRGASIYQIYPRSFLDTNGDGIGDLPGICRKLDYVASLGVDAVWVSPFFASPMADFGYDVADYCAVDPIFGTLADFDALVAKAHRLGLRLIIDQVYSHTSDRHPWFSESRADRINPRADWYVWADPKPDGSPPNNWQSVFTGPAWTWDARRAQYYLHNFLSAQPQLNVHNPAVQDALIATARFWLDRGVDGFRLDAINFAMHDPLLRDNPPAPGVLHPTRPFDLQLHEFNQSHPAIPLFLERLRAVIDGYPGRFTVAEIGGPEPMREMRLFTQGASRLNSAYGFDYLYAPRLTAELVRRSLTNWPGADDEGWPSWAFSNHDAPRFASRWASTSADTKRMADLGLLLLAALRGTIILYQGEELGLPQADVPFEQLRDPEAIANWPRTLGRDGARTPLPWRTDNGSAGFSTGDPWLPVDPRHLALSVAAQEGDGQATLNLTRRLLTLRREREALRTGAVRLLKSVDPVIGFERGDGTHRLLCLFNLGDTAAASPLRGDWSALAAVGGASVKHSHLPPLSGLIAEPRS